MKDMEKAMAALLTSDTQTEAAAKCGISDRTLRGYLADPAFYAEYQRRKRQVVSDATRQLQASYQSAIQALRDIVECEGCAEAARISAARTLLEYGMRFAEHNDILTRLEDLERAQEATE
jgi:hypothetical protein